MSTSRLRVGVIFGGRSGEHEVSLVSASSVLQALDPAKYDVVPIGITREGRWISAPQAMALLKERSGLETAPGCVLMPEPHHEGLLMLSTGQVSTGALDVVIPLVHGTKTTDPGPIDLVASRVTNPVSPKPMSGSFTFTMKFKVFVKNEIK